MPLLDAPKFYLNENLSPRLATQLRTHGIDVVTSHEAGMLAASDNDQLAFAVSEQRAIVTFNIHDFAVLHAEYIVNGQAHWGMLFSTEEPIGVLLQCLLRLANSVSALDLKNQIRWLNEFR
jgi:hypothetical protein